MAKEETAFLFNAFLKFHIAIAGVQGGIAVGLGPIKKRFLNFAQQGINTGWSLCQWNPHQLAILAGDVAAADNAGILSQVFRPDFHTDGHTFELDFVEAKTGTLVEVGIDFHFNRLVAKKVIAGQGLDGRFQLLGRLNHSLALLIVFTNGHYRDMGWGQTRRQHQALVVGVGHDEAADKTGGNPPRSGPGEFLFALR